MIYMCVCVWVCAYKCTCLGRASYPPEFELQLAVNCLTWVLTTKLRSSGSSKNS